ncbi:unnamed protein product (macronuclear) [Paramecium tetraurelia]|uniref:Protein kinase domain-containing protein n=1 Tax=Paramecium tetraurelia TaxID=5888 RepID=A0CHW3_PARTE|nr:uncharacterized protein GSPATT00038482001 [Paramecium tetraurelia]CAK70380.1 unnamed protein product [Paramecium tetraurelia]|eukprot:XP_001437777.1 hypothetical protein (macronuclear) [Paramecium tetraurelia strain d4-2]
MIYKQFVNSLIENATKEYPKRSFHLTELLAFGSEGGAFLAIAKNWGKNPQNVVIKIQKNMKANEKDFLNKLIIYQDQYESGNNKQYLPSNLIRVFECFEWKENNCVLMEVGGQSLFDYITMKTDLQMEERVKICFEICYPLYFLHQQKLIHRDIKPENFITVGEIFKLIDFGLIRSSFSQKKTQQVGNVISQAPEILENSSSYTEKVDIWSLGCVFYEVLSGQALLDAPKHNYNFRLNL